MKIVNNKFQIKWCIYVGSTCQLCPCILTEETYQVPLQKNGKKLEIYNYMEKIIPTASVRKVLQAQPLVHIYSCTVFFDQFLCMQNAVTAMTQLVPKHISEVFCFYFTYFEKQSSNN